MAAAPCHSTPASAELAPADLSTMALRLGCRLRAAVLLRLGALAGGHLPDAPPRA